jgi:hypothetical protein
MAAVCAVVTACGSEDSRCEPGAAAKAIRLPLGASCLELEGAARKRGSWSDDAVVHASEAAGGYVLRVDTEGVAEGMSIAIAGLVADRMHQQGYQSWGFSGTVLLPGAVSRDDDGRPVLEAGRTGDPAHEERGVSYHAAMFRDGARGEVIVIGALRADRAATAIVGTRDGAGESAVEIIYGPQRERLPAGDDGRSGSEPIFIGVAPTPEAALQRLSDALAAERIDDARPARPPSGWFSWNEHFDAIDAGIIEANMRAVGAELAPTGKTLIEIDDGWQRAWGDWQANDKFPDGMEAMASRIREAGLTPGIWLAPFLVELGADAAGRDPSVFVQAPDGTPLRHRISGNPRAYYVLDGTNPDAMAIVFDELERLADAGFSFFKLDFLYAGALAGGRAEDVTGVEAMRRGLGAIRDAVGTDAIINACGAPTLPVLGLADSLRIGPDTAFDGFHLAWSHVVAPARSLAARSYLWPQIYLDADQAQLREPYTLDEARAGALVTALGGAPYSLGDDLSVLPPERLAIALDVTVLDIAGGAGPARPVGLMDQAANEIAASPIIESLRFAEGFAAYPPVAFEVVGATGTTYTVSFDWDSHTVSVVPRSMR